LYLSYLPAAKKPFFTHSFATSQPSNNTQRKKKTKIIFSEFLKKDNVAGLSFATLRDVDAKKGGKNSVRKEERDREREKESFII
jgi:hypothetical protein